MTNIISNYTREKIAYNILGYRISDNFFLPLNHYSTIIYPTTELKDYLEKYAINNTIIITFIDHGYVNQLVQFYHTSIQRLHLTNFIALVDFPETKRVFLCLLFVSYS